MNYSKATNYSQMNFQERSNLLKQEQGARQATYCWGTAAFFSVVGLTASIAMLTNEGWNREWALNAAVATTLLSAGTLYETRNSSKEWNKIEAQKSR